jgi:hypothetical protein
MKGARFIPRAAGLDPGSGGGSGSGGRGLPFDLDVLRAILEQLLAHPEPPPDSRSFSAPNSGVKRG